LTHVNTAVNTSSSAHIRATASNYFIQLYAAVDSVSTDTARRTGSFEIAELFVCVRGHFQEMDITVFPLDLNPRHVEKFRECRLTDVGESELVKDEIIKKKRAVDARQYGCEHE